MLDNKDRKLLSMYGIFTLKTKPKFVNNPISPGDIHSLCLRASSMSQGMTPWRIVNMYATEIGLQTYFRAPSEMTLQPQWWHLQASQMLTRQMRDDVDGHEWAPFRMKIINLYRAIRYGKNYKSPSLKAKSDWRVK